jgi:hypothetical protein
MERFTTGLMNGSRFPVIEYFLSSGLSFLATSFSLLVALVSFDGLAGVAAILVTGLLEVLAGTAAACAFADAGAVLVAGVAVLVERTFMSGFATVVLAGSTAGFTAAVVVFAGIRAGFAAGVAFAGTTAGLAVVVAVAGTGFAVVFAVFAGAADGFVGMATGLIEITAGFGPVCTVAAEGFAFAAGVLAVGCVVFVFELAAELCAQQAPAESANTTMPVVSFISSPTSSPQAGRVCRRPPDPGHG